MDKLEETDKFLEKYNLPRLNQEEIENTNRPVIQVDIPDQKWLLLILTNSMKARGKILETAGWGELKILTRVML